MRCYIFDLDGTLCNIEHRLHYINPEKQPDQFGNVPGQAFAGLTDSKKPRLDTDVQSADWKPDWDSFNAACVGDEPIKPLCELASVLAGVAPVLFLSGRSDAVRVQTLRWLEMNIPGVRKVSPAICLYMRKDGDHRPDHLIKAEMLDMLLDAGWEPIMCFDDRQQVVDMWRARGMVCAQVAPGDF